MHVTIPPKTLLFRATNVGQKWSDVLSGHGAFYTAGGQYNRAHQMTIYATQDLLVSISEVAFHQAFSWQMQIGGGFTRFSPLSPPTLPLVSEHLLWCFTIDEPLELVDLTDPSAFLLFGHSPFLLQNPLSDAYRATQDLADQVRNYINPDGSVIQGLIAPSVRAIVTEEQPTQYVLFVMPTPFAGTHVAQMQLTLEYVDDAGTSVTSTSARIDWRRPRFRLSQWQGGSRIRKKSTTTSSGTTIPLDRWHELMINHY